MGAISVERTTSVEETLAFQYNTAKCREILGGQSFSQGIVICTELLTLAADMKPSERPGATISKDSERRLEIM